MKIFTYIIIVVLCFQSCKQKSENKLTKLSNQTTREQNNNLKIKSKTQITINEDSLKFFLENPFDLYKFKKKKNGSLSSKFYFQNYHYKPNYKGTRYQFFMFEPKTINFIHNGKKMRHPKVGYLGKNKKNTVLKEDGLIIKTFQPNDEYKDEFLNPNEILIELVAKYNDVDLPELAFVGLDSNTVITKLGLPNWHQKKCLIYQYKSKRLILKLENRKVIWLKYIYIKKGIEIEKILEN